MTTNVEGVLGVLWSSNSFNVDIHSLVSEAKSAPKVYPIDEDAVWIETKEYPQSSLTF